MTRRMWESQLEKYKDIFQINDDFQHWVDNDIWVEDTETGAIAEIAGAVHGGVLIPTTAANNDQSYLRSKQEHFLYGGAVGTAAGANKFPIHFAWEGFYAEVNPDTANLFIGMMDALASATQPMQDDGLGPKASFNGFGFFRVDATNAAGLSGVVWHTVIDNLTDAAYPQRITPLTLANQGRSGMSGAKQDADNDTLYRLEAEYRPIGAVSALLLEVEFAFWINNILVDTHRGVMTKANFAEMHFGFGVHAGEAQITSMSVDYVTASQRRIRSIV